LSLFPQTAGKSAHRKKRKAIPGRGSGRNGRKGRHGGEEHNKILQRKRKGTTFPDFKKRKGIRRSPSFKSPKKRRFFFTYDIKEEGVIKGGQRPLEKKNPN